MVTSKVKVFKVVLRKDLPAGTKIIYSIWAMKKKSNGTLCGQMNARGFKQVEVQHYNGTTISSPVTNSATIRIVLTLIIMASMLAHVVDVKGAFLHGEFEDGEIIHMIPQGFKKHFPEGSVLLLLKCLYKLKQAVKAFWRKLLCAASAMGLKQSSIRTLVGQNAHVKSYTSEQGGSQEGSQGTQKGIPDFK
jgi:hypothetical protein